MKPDSLLLYKHRPARLLRIGDRLEIELEGGELARVREKDVTLLHPGPLRSLADLRPARGEVAAAWEILAGEKTNLAELAELIYGAYTPATAWAAWQLLVEGAYFEGTPGQIRALTGEEVARKKQERDSADASRRAWQAFLERARRGQFAPEDRDFLHDVENLALRRSERSQVLRELGKTETPENAHAFLLELGAWSPLVNPYPVRLGVPLEQPDLPLPDLPQDDRLDLTGLAAYAIDDEGTDTPDDALSLDGSRLWVHVADASSLIVPDSSLDLEARARGMSLHLPEGTIHLVPREVTNRLGLGLRDESPALSFGIDLGADGEVQGFQIVPSRVRVTRQTYAQAEQLMESEPFASLAPLMKAVRARRRANGAVMIDFPEVRITIENDEVSIRPLPPLRSRAMVEEAMILVCAETARFAVENGLRLPFSQQEASDGEGISLQPGENPDSLSAMFALRRTLKRSRYRSTPAPHSGLGVAAYSQVTSPLRRYLDLVAHQQIRAFLTGREPLDETALLERIGAMDAVTGLVRQAEMLSEKHWTMVYLMQHPGWRGEGILVDKRGMTGVVIIPSLALEVRLHLNRDITLNQTITLGLRGVNLPQLEAAFRVEY